MAKRSLAGLLASLLACQQPFLAAATASEVAEAQKIVASFLSFDNASSRVTYRDERTGQVKTLGVASMGALETLAQLHGGQKVVLVCRSPVASGEPVVWDVKKKANWWKRGAILLAVTAIFIGLAGVALGSDTPL